MRNRQQLAAQLLGALFVLVGAYPFDMRVRQYGRRGGGPLRWRFQAVVNGTLRPTPPSKARQAQNSLHYDAQGSDLFDVVVQALRTPTQLPPEGSPLHLLQERVVASLPARRPPQ